jgi:hypothetical protein
MAEVINILWIDDEIDDFDILIADIKKHYEKFNIKIDVTSIEKSKDLNEGIFENKDLILADYNLDTKDESGADIIIKIRNSSCVANIILYSENQDITKITGLKEKLGYYAVSLIVYKRANLKEKLYNLLDRTLKELEDIVILRGLIIAETIDVELKVNELLLKYYKIVNEQTENFNNQVLENKYLAFFVKKTILDQIYKNLPDGDFKEKMNNIRNNVNTIMEKRNEFAHCKEENNKLIKFGEKAISVDRNSIKEIRKKMKLTILLIDELLRENLKK